jgi:hypothetical protein
MLRAEQGLILGIPRALYLSGLARVLCGLSVQVLLSGRQCCSCR